MLPLVQALLLVLQQRLASGEIFVEYKEYIFGLVDFPECHEEYVLSHGVYSGAELMKWFAYGKLEVYQSDISNSSCELMYNPTWAGLSTERARWKLWCHEGDPLGDTLGYGVPLGTWGVTIYDENDVNCGQKTIQQLAPPYCYARSLTRPCTLIVSVTEDCFWVKQSTKSLRCTSDFKSVAHLKGEAPRRMNGGGGGGVLPRCLWAALAVWPAFAWVVQ